ncbi:gamma-aminobutyric acid receptor subunit beta-like [Copidosoma floridanum]|uniref:gamma-aminobutyric acid receptor subunit beta-like n=1 Tax=Copidosoma floridanum TaxID=29053 RepID=UPI000C6F65C0|nr:gamma-aminobutyric acid receptor subunit beta-like [Copidosoma floridanum]
MRSPYAVSWSFALLAATAVLMPATHSVTFAQVAPDKGGSMFGDVNISAILDSFSVSYDKRVRPNYGGPPVEVGVTMYVLSISSLSEVKMSRKKIPKKLYFHWPWKFFTKAKPKKPIPTHTATPRTIGSNARVALRVLEEALCPWRVKIIQHQPV